MNKAYQDCSENQALKFPSIPSDLNLLVSKTSFDNPCNSSIEQVMNFFSPEHCQKSETNPCFSPEADLEVHRSTYLKKSQSLASGLDRKREVSSDDEAEDEIDHSFSCEESHVKNSAKTFYSQNAVELFESNNHGKFEGNGGMVRGESIFSIGDEKHVEEERNEDFSPQLTSEHASDLGQTTPATATHVIEKSSSLPNVRILLHASEEGSQVSPSRAYIRRHSRSFEGLDALNAKRKEVLNEVGFHANEDEERENNLWESGKIEFENDLGGGYGSNNFSGLERYETLSGRSDPNGDVMNNRGRQSLDESCKELPSTDFKIKRIEEWVSQIDLGESSPLLDTSEPFESNGKAKKVPSVSAAIVSTGKLDLKANHGMEAAKNYISSLTATSTAAQLANLGLVAIPFLSAFVSLKVLNLSGNGIVRITAGALPRGLHVLNLAKNNISTIEGLRELVRLRVLDLSYNRILRVGHGLASCSSLKELYLAGNKISEVEGLHRLLKLNILDLRFNKISTAKCLSQLAANYVSLQSLNLEGNPAQRNVGDEHLKKYLHGLLPHLVYYNKQQIKVGSLKEVAERQGRSTVTAHSSDRSLRSEHKLVRKGNHNAISKGLPSSSSHGVRGHSVRSPMQSKDHYHGRLPPAGTKGPHHNRHHFLDIGSKWLNLRPVAASIHRSRSEGHLGFA